MQMNEHFKAVSLANIWDTLEDEGQPRAGEHITAFISSGAPDTPSKIPNQELQSYSNRVFNRICVSVKKSMMILMRKTVLVSLEMDIAQRETFLAQMREQYLEDAKRANMVDAEALEWADQLDQKIREMIDAIEHLESRGGKNE